MEVNGDATKKRWTDEERLKLAEKLDKELDDFIAGLERKPYTEGWPEERWEEVRLGRDYLEKTCKNALSGDGKAPVFYEESSRTWR